MSTNDQLRIVKNSTSVETRIDVVGAVNALLDTAPNLLIDSEHISVYYAVMEVLGWVSSGRIHYPGTVVSPDKQARNDLAILHRAAGISTTLFINILMDEINEVDARYHEAFVRDTEIALKVDGVRPEKLFPISYRVGTNLNSTDVFRLADSTQRIQKLLPWYIGNVALRWSVARTRIRMCTIESLEDQALSAARHETALCLDLANAAEPAMIQSFLEDFEKAKE